MSDILPFQEWSKTNSTETDPIKQLKQFSGYVRQETWKQGIYDESVEQELREGIDNTLVSGGHITEDTLEEKKNAMRQALMEPEDNLDNDARFVYDDMTRLSEEEQGLSTSDREIISNYVASRNLAERDKDPVMAAQADSYAEAARGILANRDIVNKAKRNAMARGEVPAVSIVNNDGTRYVEVGPDADDKVIRDRTEELIKRGAIAPEDIPSLSLNFKDSGFGSTNARVIRSQNFMDDLDAVVKGDEYLNSIVTKQAKSLAFREQEDQQSLAESALSTTQDILGGAVKTIGGLVTGEGMGGMEDALRESMDNNADFRDELVTALKNNTALADKYSDTEIDTFADDYIKVLKGPTYRPDKDGSGVALLSTGVPIVAAGLALRPEALEAHMTTAGLNDMQKQAARDQRDKLAESSTPKTVEILAQADDEFVDKLAKARESGITDRQFAEEWMSNEENYNNFANRAKSVALEGVKAVGSIALSVPALFGNQKAAEALTDMNKSGSNYSEYAELFGDRFGVGQQLVNIVPSVAVDLLASAGTGGAYFAAKTGVKSAATGVASRVAARFASQSAAKVVPQAIGTALSGVDEVASVVAQGVQAVAPSKVFGAVSNAMKKGALTAGKFTDNLMSVGPATFLRSAGGTYASVYGELPSDMSHEAKHEAAIGYAVTAGVFTAALTAGMSTIGLGGTEKLATRNLDDLTFRQVSKLYSQTRRASANVTDQAIKKVVRENTSGAFKSLIKDVSGGFASEGFEEGVDQAFQIMVEQAALKKDTPIREIGKGILDAFILGGLMGTGASAIRQAIPSVSLDSKAQEAQKMEKARFELYTGIAKKLTDANSPKSAEALAKAFADADATAAAASTTAQTPTTIDVANLKPTELPTAELFEKWDPTDKTTGLLADYVGTLVTYAGQQGVLKSDEKGGVFLEYTERKTGVETGQRQKKGNVVRIDLGSSAQLANGLIERKFTALRTTQDVGDIKAGSLVVKSGNVYYALPHIDDAPQPPYIVRNNKGEPIGLGFQKVRMVGSNATRDNFMVTFDSPLLDVAKYYGIDFTSIESLTLADNTGGTQSRQTKADREAAKAEAKAHRAVLVTPDPETQVSPLQQLVEVYQGLDVLLESDVDSPDLTTDNLKDLIITIDEVLSEAEVTPELSKQLTDIQNEAKVIVAEREEFTAFAQAEFQELTAEQALKILENLPSGFNIRDFRQIKIRVGEEIEIVTPVSINKERKRVIVKRADGKKYTVGITAVDGAIFNEFAQLIEAKAISNRYGLANLRKMDSEELTQIDSIAEELVDENPKDAELLSWIKRLRERIQQVRNEVAAKAAKAAEKEAAAKVKEAKAVERKETKKEAPAATEPAVVAETPIAETNPAPVEPPKQRKRKAKVKEEILTQAVADVAEGDVPPVDEVDVEEDEDIETELIDEVVPDSSPLTDEEFAGMKGILPFWRGMIDKIIAENPDYRDAIVSGITELAIAPQKGNRLNVNDASVKELVSRITSSDKNKTTIKVGANKQKKAAKTPDVTIVEETPEEEKNPTTAVIKVEAGTKFRMPKVILSALGTAKNVLHPLKKSDRDAIELALVFAATGNKSQVVTLTQVDATKLPAVSGVTASEGPTTPVVMIKKGRSMRPAQDKKNLANLAAAKLKGGNIRILVVSATSTKFDGSVTLVNELEDNVRKAEAGRRLTEAVETVTGILDQKVYDGKGKLISFGKFIERMRNNTERNNERYLSEHRDAFQNAVEDAGKALHDAQQLLSKNGRQSDPDMIHVAEQIAGASAILDREIQPKAPKSDVKATVDYNTEELRPVFRSEAEKPIFEQLVDHGHPVGEMGEYLGKYATGIDGIKRNAKPKEYLSGKRIYLIQKIRERYPVLEWAKANEQAASKGKPLPYRIAGYAKSIKYTADPNNPTWTNAPVIVDAAGEAVFTNDPMITAAQLAHLGQVKIPESFDSPINKSINTYTDSSGTYVIGVTAYNREPVLDGAKQSTVVNLEKLNKAQAIAAATGEFNSIPKSTLDLMAPPDSRTRSRNAVEYYQKAKAFMINRITKGDPDALKPEQQDVVSEAGRQLMVEMIEFSISHGLAKTVVNSKQFADKRNKVDGDEEGGIELSFFKQLGVLTDDEIKSILTPKVISDRFAGVTKSELASLIENRYPDILTERNVNLKGEARENNVIMNYGVKMVRRMTDVKYMSGPSPKKILDTIHTRFRQTYAKSQVGGTNVSFEYLMETPMGGFSLAEASPDAGVLDVLMSEMEAIEDASVQDIRDTVTSAMIMSLDNSPSLKALFIKFGLKITSGTGMFTGVGTNTDSDTLLTMLGNVINTPRYQGIVRTEMTKLSELPDGRRMFSLLHMMGWAPDPESDTGFRIPTAEEIEATSELNLDPEQAAIIREGTAEELRQLAESRNAMVEGSVAYRQALEEALQSDEGQEIRELVLRKSEVDNQLRQLRETKNLLMMIRESGNPNTQEWQERKFQEARQRLDSKLKSIDARAKEIDRNIVKLESFVRGFRGGIVDPAPILAEAVAELEKIDNTLAEIGDPDPLTTKEKLRFAELEQILIPEMNLRDRVNQEIEDFGSARPKTLAALEGARKKITAKHRRDYDRLYAKNSKFNEIVSKRERAASGREELVDRISTLKKLNNDPNVRSGIDRLERLKAELVKLEAKHEETKAKIVEEVPKQAWSDIKRTPKQQKYLDRLRAIEKQRVILADAFKEMNEAIGTPSQGKAVATHTRAKKKLEALELKLGNQPEGVEKLLAFDPNRLTNEDTEAELKRLKEAIAANKEEQDQMSNIASSRVRGARSTLSTLRRQRYLLAVERKNMSGVEDVVRAFEARGQVRHEEFVKDTLDRIDSMEETLKDNATTINEDIAAALVQGTLDPESRSATPEQIQEQVANATSPRALENARLREMLPRLEEKQSSLSADLANAARKSAKAREEYSRVAELIDNLEQIENPSSSEVNQLKNLNDRISGLRSTYDTASNAEADVRQQFNTVSRNIVLARRQLAGDTVKLTTPQRSSAPTPSSSRDRVMELAAEVTLATQNTVIVQNEISQVTDEINRLPSNATKKRKALADKLAVLDTELAKAEAHEKNTKQRYLVASSELNSRPRTPLRSMSSEEVVSTALNRAANSAEIENLGLMESPIVALENIAKSGVPHLRVIAKMLLRNKDALGGLKVFVESFDPRVAGFQAGDIIAINLSGHNGRGVADVLIHEVVHFVTRQALSDPDVAARMDDFRKLTRVRLLEMSEDLSEFEYALSSNEEFLSAVFTDPRLQEALDVRPDGKPLTLFQKILNFILSVLNADNANTRTAMREIVRFTNQAASSMTYGSRVDLNREARTVRFQKQYAGRVQDFLNEMTLMMMDTTLFDFQDRLNGEAIGGPLASPSATQGSDLDSRIRQRIPAGMTLVAGSDSLGAMRLEGNVVYYNPAQVAESIDGYSPQVADQIIDVMVAHEVAHAAANSVMTPQDYDEIAAELGPEELNKIANDHYRSAYPNVEERATKIEEDRQNGDLTDRTVAGEWVRAQIEKAVLGQSTEEVLSRFVKKPNIVSRLIEAIRSFVSSLGKSQDNNFSLKIAADISRASRVMEQLMNGGSLPATPAPHPQFAHAGEFVEAAQNGSHQTMFVMRLADAAKADKTSNSVWEWVKKLATAVPNNIDELMRDRQAKINESRLIVERFAPQYRLYLEQALKAGADINDVAKVLGSTSPVLDEVTEADIVDKVDKYRNSLPANDPDKVDKVRRYREVLTTRAVQANLMKFRNEQNDAATRLRAISPKFIDLLQNFRKEIDRRQMAIGYDATSEGVYLTRTYKFFNTKGWAQAARRGGEYRLNGEVIDFNALREQASRAFENQVRAEYVKAGKSLTPDLLRDEVHVKLDSLLAQLEREATKDKGESISQDIRRALPKGPIDPALRQLLGETVNPFENAIRTFGYVSMLDTNKQALTAIRDALIASGYGSTTEKVGYVQVFGQGSSETMAPLAGLFVREDIAKELNAEFAGSAARLLNHTDKVMQGVATSLSRMSGWAMTTKTLMGVGFYMRNAVTNQIILLAAQGIIPNPVHAYRSYKLAYWANFESTGKDASEADIQEMLKLTRLGIMRDSNQRGNFDDMLRGFADRTGTTYESVIDELARSARDADYASFHGLVDRLQKFAGKGIDVLSGINGWMDDAAKVQVFYYERGELVKAYPNMTEAELDTEAAKKVKLTMPGHIEQLNLVKSFNRNPLSLLIFPFARWKTEVLRTLVNTYKLGYSEIRSGNPRMVKRGMQRVASNMAVVTVGSTLAGMILSQAFAKLIDDEDEEKNKSTKIDDPAMIAALRLALPEWQRGHTLNVSTNGKEVRVVDMTAMMPYSAVSDSINIIREGLATGKGVDAKGIASYWGNQFIGSQIAANAVMEVFRNEDTFGKAIYQETDSLSSTSVKVLTHIMSNAYKPSVVAKGEQLFREGEQERDQIVWGELLGARPIAYKMDRVASSGFYNLKAQFDDAKRLRSRLSSGKFISDEDFAEVMMDAQDHENRVQAKAHQFTNTLSALGYDDRSIVLAAYNTGTSKKRAREAIMGINPTWLGNSDWVSNTATNIEKGGEDDPRRRIELLRSTYLSMPPVVDVTGQ